MMIQLCKEIKVKLDKTTKIWYLILRVFWLLLSKFNFWKKDRTLDQCTKFVILDIKYCFDRGDSDLYYIIKKFQNIMTAVVVSSSV